MEKQVFIRHLEANNRIFLFRETRRAGTQGIEVSNLAYQTKTFFANQAVADNELDRLIAATHQGRNVEHITRVTGYFSKVAAWNKGKVAELQDRHRTPMA